MTTQWDPIKPLVESKNMIAATLFQIYKAISKGQCITPLLYQQKKS